MPLLKCCLNGGRSHVDQEAVPVTAEELALEAKKVAALGVDVFHVHPRDADGRESLHPEDILAAVSAIRSAVPGARVGVTTRAEACPDRATRLRLVEEWPAPVDGGPDFASVNWHEPGAADVAAALVFNDIDVEAGLFTVESAQAFAAVARDGVERLLVEVSPLWSAALDGVAAAKAILAALEASKTFDVLRGIPTLVHGEDGWAWPVLAWARSEGYDVRIGLEDTLVRPDGRPARDNADLVRIVLGRTDVGEGHYATLRDGLQMYYEVHGHGRPLVLVHGGVLTIGLTWSQLIPALALTRQVIAVELQGHGHTADRSDGFDLTRLADDVHELCAQLGLTRPDVMGFSLGGMVALELARRHPGSVGRLVLASVSWWSGERRGTVAAVVPFADGPLPTEEDFDAMARAYEEVAPEPTHFTAFMQAVSAMVQAHDGWSAEQLASVVSQTLVVGGDSDLQPVVETAELVAALPEGQLLVLPATTHMQVTHRAELLVPALARFLG